MKLNHLGIITKFFCLLFKSITRITKLNGVKMPIKVGQWSTIKLVARM